MPKRTTDLGAARPETEDKPEVRFHSRFLFFITATFSQDPVMVSHPLTELEAEHSEF